MTIHWKAVEQYFTVVLFGLQFYQFVILENVILGLGTVRSERVKPQYEYSLTYQQYLMYHGHAISVLRFVFFPQAFPFYPVCNFALDTVRSERVNV